MFFDAFLDYSKCPNDNIIIIIIVIVVVVVVVVVVVIIITENIHTPLPLRKGLEIPEEWGGIKGPGISGGGEGGRLKKIFFPDRSQSSCGSK